MSSVHGSKFFEENIKDMAEDKPASHAVLDLLSFCSNHSSYLDIKLVRTEGELERYTMEIFCDYKESYYSPSIFNGIEPKPFINCMNAVCENGQSAFVLCHSDKVSYKTLISKRKSDGTSVTFYDGPFKLDEHETMYYLSFVGDAIDVGEGVREFAGSNPSFDISYSIVREDSDEHVITNRDVEL